VRKSQYERIQSNAILSSLAAGWASAGDADVSDMQFGLRGRKSRTYDRRDQDERNRSWIT
jgi:hypothetical protein